MRLAARILMSRLQTVEPRGLRLAPGPSIVTACCIAALAAPAASAAEPCPPSPPPTYESAGAPGSDFPNDPLSPRLGALTQLRAPAAWARGGRGQGAVVAIVDTGVDLRHPDLGPNLIAGVEIAEGDPGEPPDCPPGPQDENFHGTFMAGLAAAVADNGIGVGGVAPDAKIMPVRAMGDDNPGVAVTTERVTEGIRYAADHGADVINHSGNLGIYTLDPAYMKVFNDAVAYAWGKGAVFVASAGNNSAPGCELPAAANYAVCAAAVDRAGLPVATSNQPVHIGGGVALRAPAGSEEGCNDEATWSTSLPERPRRCDSAPLGYDQRAGTSAAAANVSGVAALLAGAGLTNEQIVECLRDTSSNRGTYDPVMGYGIVDAGAASGCATNREAPGPGPGAHGSADCLAHRSPIGPRNIGRIRLGYTRPRLLRLAVQPVRRTRRFYRYCVKSDPGQVTAVFSRRGRVVLVATTATAHENGRVLPGRSARSLRAYPHRRAVGPGLFRASPRSRQLIGIRRGRVRFVAVCGSRLLRKPMTLRRYLRLAGV